ncbi:MAG: mandelate racemase [Rhodospirillaceae bacterium]|jgi:L-alanine-DL-glutamate epimerase-like enolase superfamily enzyme|nr:mandelate racemase [Rhodospirillaceae bacterium]
MRIIEIREKPVSLSDPMSNAAINFQEMTASAVAIVVDAGHKGTFTGYGFSSVGRYAQSGLIAERFAPRLKALEEVEGADGGLDPVRGWAAMMANEKPGGDGDRAGAVGVLDMALWDVAAKIEGTPLWRILSERYNEDRHHDLVPVYATGGHYYPDGDLEALREEIRGYTDQGYERIKIKCGQGDLADDCSRIEAALSVLDGDGSRLAVDVNCMCSTSGDTQEMADAYSPYGLSWIEEPGHPHDFELLKALTDYYEGAIATGENLFSMSETYNLLIYGGLRGDRDLIQVDPALSYGMVEYANIVKLSEAGEWPRSQMVPHAGHLLAYHAVAGLSLGAHEIAARPDFILGGLQEDVMVADGHATLSQTPGVGFESHPKLWKVLQTL